MAGWRIWYSDGEKVDGSTLFDWTSAPDEGVLGVVVFVGTNEYGQKLREIWCGGDWYGFDGDRVSMNSTAQEWGEWADCTVPNPKRGIGVTDEAWAEAYAQMLEA